MGRKKSKFRGIKGIGDMDDAFFYAEDYLAKMGKVIGLKKKKNLLLKTEKQLASKLHQTHSGVQKRRRLMEDFRRKAYLDTKLKIIKRRFEDI